jgi:hypothetical protein
MRKLLIVSAFVLGIGTVSFAQGKHKPNPAKQAEKLKLALSLNDDQTAKVKAIYQAQAKSFDSIRTAVGENADKKAIAKQRRPIVAANKVRIKAVLTAQQVEAFDKQLAAKKGTKSK